MPDDRIRKRLAELVLHIANKMEASPSFGSVMLNKVLFYCDSLWYREHGVSISGDTYQKLNKGPAPRQMKPALVFLEEIHAAEVIPRTYLGYTQKRIIAKRAANLQQFTPEQVALIDEVIESLRSQSATAVSERSHQHIGWKLADYGEEIPYFTFHLSDEGAEASDVKRGLELAKEFGWGKDTQTST